MESKKAKSMELETGMVAIRARKDAVEEILMSNRRNEF